MKGIAILLLLPIAALASEAAGGHHQPSIKDVIWPAVNFTILFSFLGWKLRKPVAMAFARYAEEVEEIFHQAKDNFRMAETKKAEVEANLNNFELLKVQEKERLNEELNLYKIDTASETREHIDQMKLDAAARLEYEKQQMVRKLNQEIIETIIDEAKEGINQNSQLKKTVTERLMAKL